MGQPLAAVRDEVSFADRRAVAHDHQRLDRLTPPFVGHADDRHLGHGLVLVQAVLHLNGGHVLAARDDHVLLAVRDHEVGPVEMAAVTGVEPPAPQRRLRLLRLLPVPGEDVIGPCQHLTILIDGDLHSQRRGARSAEQMRPCGGTQVVPLRRRPVDGQQR